MAASYEFTNFIGLQSIAYPALDPAIMASRDEEVLRNSVMYLHEVCEALYLSTH